MYVVGLTGGIGSGKTAASDYLASLGIGVVDADVVARDIVAIGQPALNQIAQHFGSDILQADGSLNRSALRTIVFHQPSERKVLESITHPAIRQRIQQQLASIMAAQLTRTERLQKADDIVINHGDLDELYQQLDLVHQRYLQLSQTH